jgi:NAD(P)-dependent dehydrogenase (short-subunit alcohol dehydrogenase family)
VAELSGRIALVTGASRGIGAATARALAAAGAKVICSDLAAPDALAEELDGLALRQDVTREGDWEAAMAFARDKAGGLDILVNNAGLFLMKPLTETSLDDWRRIHSVNVEGVFLGCRAAIPLLAERAGRWSGGTAIVNLSSMAGLVGSAGAVCYNASKGAVRLLSKGLAMELAGVGVRVNSVHPGVIQTAMGDEVVAAFSGATGVGDNEARSQLAQRHPLGRMGAPENVADAVVFLASDRAGFMTGTEVVVDGGFTAN